MGFRRLAARALGQLLLFLCGLGVVAAWQAGFYACATLLALVAVWTATIAIWPDRFVAAPRTAAEGGETASSQAERQLLGSLLDQTPAPLLTLHPDGALRAANRAARTLFQTEHRIKPPPDLLHGLKNSPPGGRFTVTLDTPAGPRTYAVSVTDLIGPEGELRLAALLDIQPEIRAAEAAALRDLLQVLGHEIMNALTPIASLAATAVDLLSDETPASTALARDAMATLARRAEGLPRFVDAYRTLARLPPPNLKPTSLTALLDEVARLFRSRWEVRGVMLEVERPRPDAIVALDMDLMVHALMNILSNGAEASLGVPDGARRVLLAGRSDDGASFTIEDSGPGVQATDSERIFQPFFTTKAEGTGVGLSFARQVALSHGGELTLLPQQPGAGAAFRLTL